MLQVGRVEYDTHCRCRWHPRVIEFIIDHPGYENQECILEFIYMGIQSECGKVAEGVLPSFSFLFRIEGLVNKRYHSLHTSKRFQLFLLEDSLTEFQYTGIKRKETEALEIPLHYSCLENPMDRGAWQVTVHRVAKNWTELKGA